MLVLAASPGPGVFATIARALASGFRPSLAVICGIVLGDIIFLLFAAFGLSMVARALGNLFFIVKLCGGAYLIWLGVKIWLKKPEPVAENHNLNTHSQWGNFATGLVITLSNPKVILFYCGFLPTFLDLSALTFTDLVIVVTIITTERIPVAIGIGFLYGYRAITVIIQGITELLGQGFEYGG